MKTSPHSWLPALSLLFPCTALAQECPPLSDTVTIVGSTAARTLIRELAKILQASNAGQAPPLLYAGLGSCAGVEALVLGEALSLETLTYWDATGAEKTCAAPNTLAPDIAVSDVFAGTCVPLPNGLPSNIGDFQGPVQSMVFAVPLASTQTAISAEAAYFVYGFGSDSQVEPWTDVDFIYQRSSDSGTQAMIAAAIAVPSERWRGTPTTGSTDMLEKLLAVPSGRAENAIGILSSSHLEQNRATLRALAFQAFGETCGMLPNRTARSHEKSNVRDGSYPIWGPLHLLARVDANQRPSRPAVEKLVGYITGTLPPPGGADLIALQAEEQLVPQCAMQVSRAVELGPTSPYTAEQPCGCAYEEAANGTTECKPCQTTAQCAQGQTCSLGYCETF